MNEVTVEGARASLVGTEVSITGRLASMARDEAVERIHAAGGRYARDPRASTALLVIGQGGPPLGADGRLTQSLRRAHELQETGHALRIVHEEELLSLLDLDAMRDGLHRLYTTEQLGRILDVDRGEVRAWVRRGLLRPARVVGRLCFFGFSEVACARALARLLREGVSAQRILASLAQLAAWRAGDAASAFDLAALERTAELYVRLEDGRIAEPSGQLQLGFEEEQPHTTEPAAPRPSVPGPHAVVARDAADSWFERGIEAEEMGRFEVAAAAYQRALQEGGARPEVLFNLGNTLYALDHKDAAASSFERATALDPDYVEAWNNLGNVLAELDRDADAARAYRRGLAIAPDYADAHFNLAEALTRQGQLDKAEKHWRAYLRLDPTSPWAGEVRARLATPLEDDV